MKTYPGEVHAVRGISFSVAAGESFGLLGPNGAGKTMTIGMLNTTIRPTSGRALLVGHDVQADPMGARRVSSVVFQDPVLDRPLTGRQNLQLHLRLWRVPKAEGLARLNIWGMRSPAEMAALSLAVTCGYAVVATAAAMRIFARQGVQ